jgi:hypothetical protein
MIISRAQMSAKRNSGICAYRELLGDAGIPGHSCLFRNHKYLILTPSPSPTPSPSYLTLTRTHSPSHPHTPSVFSKCISQILTYTI